MMPLLSPAATNASSYDHAIQHVAALVWTTTVGEAALDDVLHRHMLESTDVAAMKSELGLKCKLVISDVRPLKQAMTVYVYVSHRCNE
jgi:hypothetical protein